MAVAVSSQNIALGFSLSPEQPIHLIGIGGIGMSGLAKALAKAGFTVSGSDVEDNAYLAPLKELGITVTVGHRADAVPAGAVVVVSTAIHPDNPELLQAQAWQLPVVHRSQILREIFQGPAFGFKTPVGITGTHGKTSVTGMTGTALHAAGLDPTIMAGGKIPGFNTNALVGDARQVIVAELDESDGSVVAYNPGLAILTNLELDHAEHFPGGIKDLVATIQRFIENLPDGATLIANGSCPQTAELLRHLPNHVQLVLATPKTLLANAAQAKAHYQIQNPTLADNGCYHATITCDGQPLTTLQLSTPGWHQLENALMAIVACHQLGADMAQATQGLNGFAGMGRRFEPLGTRHGATLIDDYAHHPTEVSATLQTAKQCVGNTGRVLAVFQPHRFTRLQTFWQDFQDAFGAADHVWVTDVYAASESPMAGINAPDFVAAMQARHPALNVSYVPFDSSWQAARQALDAAMQPGDMVLSLGAGNITHLLRGWAE
jgi:UDP-N-acetylmuramate--alanine ligase